MLSAVGVGCFHLRGWLRAHRQFPPSLYGLSAVDLSGHHGGVAGMTSPPRDQFLTHCGFCGNIPSWLVHDFVYECSLGEDKCVLVRLLSGPNQTWFANSGEQDPIQMLVSLSAASLPPSEGNRRSAASGATGKMNKSCLIQENKSASRYLCWLHLYAHSKFLMWTTGASERIVCIKLEIKDLGINYLVFPPAEPTELVLLLPSRISFNLLYIFPLCWKGCELCRDQSLLNVYAGLIWVFKKVPES